ncbi:class I SAM-dependent methyltransferase [Spirillospora sp. CA-142024]|uniref:class I SAM-dependent methyltransferase n=1 Tax=Spirillospora sp. CA-142024 TaxID=3240036 RepID=UPI003D8C173E
MTATPSDSSGMGNENGWDGSTGRHWVQHEDRHDRMLASLTPRLIDAAQISRADKVLDIGCGCGETSRIAARSTPEGEVLGVDISAPMLDQAREQAQAEGLVNLRFEQADAATTPFTHGHFDVTLSRFGVMFFDDARAAFRNISEALRPGGTLAFLCWQEVFQNEHFMVPFRVLASFGTLPDIGAPGAPGPFSLADPDGTRELLSQAGLCDIEIQPIREPLRIGSDVQDVVDYFRYHPAATPIIAAMDEATLARALGELEEAVRPFQTPDGVFLESAAWLVTARR